MRRLVTWNMVTLDGYFEGKNKWDIATIPGGSGNWGGSYLAIPKRAKNPKAAWNYITEMQSPRVWRAVSGGAA